MRPAEGSAFAIVVCYSGFGVADDFVELLRALRRASVNAIVVCNGMPRDPAMARLREEAHRILVRRNIGRDIGAYRAATLYLNATGLPASRVLYFNDSVIYLPGAGLDHMVRELAKENYAVTGTFENHVFNHHIGSYAFSMSGDAFRNRRLLKFWRRYRPYDIRPHAIDEGEIGLSKRLKRLGYNFDVVYSIDKLGEKLRTLEAADILDLVKYMPMKWRAGFFEHLRQHPLGPPTRLLRELAQHAAPDKARALSETSAAPPRSLRLAPAKTEAPAQADRIRNDLSKLALIDLFLGEISVHSQVHAGFGFFHVLMGAPLVKKDLLQRDVFVEHDCNLILSDVSPETRAAVMRQLINRGRPIHLRGMRRFLAIHGLD